MMILFRFWRLSRSIPKPTVKINLNELETDYEEVKQFINSINSGNWQAAVHQLGQEILCECSTVE